MILNLIGIGLLGCSSSQQMSARTVADRRVASVASTTDSFVVDPGRSDSTPEAHRLPPDVQQDPLARLMRLQQIRRSIAARVKAVPDARYRQSVRPSLARQLGAMGFDDQDIAYFLSDLDETRANR